MRVVRLVLLSCLLLWRARAAPFLLPASSREQCPSVLRPRVSSALSRVVGGEVASPATRSYVAYVTDHVNGTFCTAALIASTHALTAAHCCIALQNASVAVRAAHVGARDAVRLRVVQKLMHPHFVDDGEHVSHDACLLQLERPIDPPFLRVNVNESVPLDGSFATVAGYGRSAFHKPADGRLRQVDVPVVGYERCQRLYGATAALRQAEHVCAGYEHRSGCDACLGDSGAPLLQLDGSSRAVLLALVTSGRACGALSQPGIYTRISSLQPWLRDKVQVVQSSDALQVFDDADRAPASLDVVAAVVGGGVALLLLVGVGGGLALGLFARRDDADDKDDADDADPLGKTAHHDDGAVSAPRFVPLVPSRLK